MDGAGGLIDACLALAIAAVVVCRIRSADAPARVRIATHAVLAVALLVQAGVSVFSAVGDGRDIVLRLEETDAKLLQMEEILQDYGKHDLEMASNLAAMLSRNPGNIKKMSYNKARSPDGAENAELTVTMKDAADVNQPQGDGDNHTNEIMKGPKLNNDDAPPAGTPSPSQGEEKQEQKPWRSFYIPANHVFVLDCSGDALTLRIRAPSAGLDDQPTRGATACSSRQQQQQAFLYDAGIHRTLFLPPPGKEHVVPVPWPRAEMFQKLTAALLRGEESPVAKEKAVPESFSLSPDFAVFYGPTAPDGMTMELLITANEVVEYEELSVEDAARVGTALTAPAILPTSFPDFCPSHNDK